MIKPLYDKVLIQKLDEDNQKIGGLFVPSNSTTTYAKGIVVAVGTVRLEFGHEIKLTVKVGDTVLYNPNQAAEVTDDNEKYFIISERDIAAIV